MGKAAREKRRYETDRRRTWRSDMPQWAGANGFNYAWKLAETYVSLGDKLNKAYGENFEVQADAELARLEHGKDILIRQKATIDAALKKLEREGGESAKVTIQSMVEPQGPPVPGTNDFILQLPGSVAREIVEGEGGEEEYHFTEEHRDYGQGMYISSLEHQIALRDTIPLLFDPLSTPETDERAAEGLRLPFPVVTCDFLSEQGMSMPVITMDNAVAASHSMVSVNTRTNHPTIGSADTAWVGLVAATMRQEGDAIDVWPIVTTLRPEQENNRQTVDVLLYGRCRLNGELSEPPAGMKKIQIGPASCWIMDEGRDNDKFAEMWIVRPALAACSALSLLEAVNVEIQEAELSRPERRRAERTGAQPAMEVIVRHKNNQSGKTDANFAQSIDWQHRWTVRGHWKHFTRGPVFNANPRKRVMDAEHGECIKIWCPPFIKGPDDKPLVLKSRRIID